MNKTLSLLLFLLFPLSGCGDSGFLDIANLPVNGEQITTISGQVKDASTQKEALYLHTRENRDNLQKAMYAQSGLQVKFKMIEVTPGVHVQVMESVVMREYPKFDQPLPNGPSVHPVWNTVNTLIDKGISGLLWYTGIKEAGKFLTNQTDKTGTTYNGNYDYRPSTAQPYVYNFTP